MEGLCIFCDKKIFHVTKELSMPRAFEEMCVGLPILKFFPDDTYTVSLFCISCGTENFAQRHRCKYCNDGRVTLNLSCPFCKNRYKRFMNVPLFIFDDGLFERSLSHAEKLIQNPEIISATKDVILTFKDNGRLFSGRQNLSSIKHLDGKNRLLVYAWAIKILECEIKKSNLKNKYIALSRRNI